MKIYSFFRLKDTRIILMLLCLVSAGFFFSCENNIDEDSAEAYFSIEGNPTGLSVTKTAKTQSYTVRSNRPWQVVAQGTDNWVKAFPAEGDDDGIFSFIVSENATFSARSMNFAFVVDGKEQPVLFTVNQEANVPYITITEASKGVTIAATGGNGVINIKSNVKWTYSLSNTSWLSEVAVSPTQITMKAGVNEGPQRSVVMTLKATDYPSVTAQVTFTQSPGSVVFEDNFNWLTSCTTNIFYDSTNPKRYDAWTADEIAHGWTTTINTYAGNTPVLYAINGVAKLGKTTYGGDLISPKLVNIVGTKNVTVKFKAVPYMTQAGAKDDNILVVSVIGPGTVSTSQFIIDNWPTYPSSVSEHEAYCAAFWNQPEAERSFTITGATAETQIKFLGGDYNLKGVGQGKNRLFIDDVKVSLK